jgi:hypothetical protein
VAAGRVAQPRGEWLFRRRNPVGSSLLPLARTVAECREMMMERDALPGYPAAMPASGETQKSDRWRPGSTSNRARRRCGALTG